MSVVSPFCAFALPILFDCIKLFDRKNPKIPEPAPQPAADSQADHRGVQYPRVGPHQPLRPDLELDPENPKVARGNVADVFRFRDRTSESNAKMFVHLKLHPPPRIPLLHPPLAHCYGRELVSDPPKNHAK